MARPKKESRVDDSVITDLASIGCTNRELVVLTGLSEDTLERRFADVIEKGRASMRMSLRRKQYQSAMDGDRTMLVWLGKQLLGQTDRSEVTQETTVHVEVSEARERLAAALSGTTSGVASRTGSEGTHIAH